MKLMMSPTHEKGISFILDHVHRNAYLLSRDGYPQSLYDQLVRLRDQIMITVRDRAYFNCHSFDHFVLGN